MSESVPWNKWPKPEVWLRQPGDPPHYDDCWNMLLKVNLNGKVWLKTGRISCSHGDVLPEARLDYVLFKLNELLQDIQYAAERGLIPQPEMDTSP